MNNENILYEMVDQLTTIADRLDKILDEQLSIKALLLSGDVVVGINQESVPVVTNANGKNAPKEYHSNKYTTNSGSVRYYVNPRPDFLDAESKLYYVYGEDGKRIPKVDMKNYDKKKWSDMMKLATPIVESITVEVDE